MAAVDIEALRALLRRYEYNPAQIADQLSVALAAALDELEAAREQIERIDRLEALLREMRPWVRLVDALRIDAALGGGK